MLKLKYPNIPTALIKRKVYRIFKGPVCQEDLLAEMEDNNKRYVFICA